MAPAYLVAFLPAVPVVCRPVTSARSRQTSSRRPRCAPFHVSAVLPAQQLAPQEANGVTAEWSPASSPTPHSPLSRFMSIPQHVRLRALLAILFGVLGSMCAVATPLMYSRTLDAVLTLSSANPGFSVLRIRLLQQMCAYMLEALCTFSYIRLMTSVADALVDALRMRVLKVSLRNDLSFFDLNSPSINRALTTDVPMMRSLLVGNLSADRGLRSVLQIIAGVLTCLFIDAKLGAAVFVLLLPVASLVAGKLGLRRVRQELRYADAENEARVAAAQTVSAIRTVKAYGGEENAVQTLRHRLNEILARSSDVALARAISETMVRGTIYVTLIAVMALGGWQVGLGNLAMQKFIAMTSFSWILLFSLIGIVYTFNDAQSLQGALTRTYGLVDSAERAIGMQRKAMTNMVAAKSYEVVFRNVSFAYPTRAMVGVVNDISFTIPRNATVALVGPSGAGKSTIAALLARFYRPQTGSIVWNGVDIHDVPAKEYVGLISYVDQQPTLFHATVRDNIAYGVRSASDEEIVAAARAANAHDFIMDLPDGYDTILSDGSALSGGQRQRVAIARALLRDAPLLVLDEFSSALDTQSEAAIQKALIHILRDRSALVIAHRLSTIRNADNIIFLNDGTIVEQGSWEQLMRKQDGALRKLVDANGQLMRDGVWSSTA